MIALRSIIIGIFAALLMSGCGSGNRETLLSYKFNDGDSVQYDYVTRANTTAYENDILVYSSDTIIDLLYTQEVEEKLSDNRAKCKFTYFDKASGQSWISRIIMSSNGAITDILDDSLSETNNSEYFRKLYEQASPEYPEHPIKEGFEWSNTVKVLLDNGTVDAKTTYVLKSFVGELGFECAVIEYSGEMFIPLESAGPDENGVVYSGQDKIEVEGRMFFALNEGMIIKHTETSVLIRAGTVASDSEKIDFKLIENKDFRSEIIL